MSRATDLHDAIPAVSYGNLFAIRRCRKVYSRRLEAFLEAANHHELPLDFPFTDGGMNQTGFFRDPRLDSTHVSQLLSKNGFDIPPIGRFALGTSPPCLVFGFTAFDERTIKIHLAKLAQVLHKK